MICAPSCHDSVFHVSWADCGRQSTSVPILRNVDSGEVTTFPWLGVSTKAKWYVASAVVPGKVAESATGAVNTPTVTVPPSSASVSPHLSETETREAEESMRASVPLTRMPSGVWRADTTPPAQSHAVFAVAAPATAKLAFVTESFSAFTQSADAMPS